MPICRVKSAAVEERHNSKTNSIIRSQMVGLDFGNGFELPFRVGLGSPPPPPPPPRGPGHAPPTPAGRVRH